MSPTAQKEIKWRDKRLLLMSAVVGLASYALLLSAAMRHTPPEGFAFERLPALSGVYACCEAGGRYSQSWVNGYEIKCSPFGYYALGTNRNDCGLRQLHGQPVEVVRAALPAWELRNLVVVRITSNGQIFYDISDQRIRELWIDESKRTAVTLAFIFLVVINCALLIYLNRNIKSKENKKSAF